MFKKITAVLFLMFVIYVFVSAQDRFVLVKGGDFQMGSTSGDSDDKPVHSVTVSSFYMSKYEVIQGEYKTIMGKNPASTSKGIGANYPVNCVSWYEAVEYCNALSRKEGLTPAYTIDKSRKDPNNNSEYDDIKWIVECNMNANGYRLPTEAEWEYASRGGTSSRGYKYAGSSNIDSVAWYWRNSGDNILTGNWDWDKVKANNGGTHPVGCKQANELGLYDMSGNVWEWCWDWYGSYSVSCQSNPTGASSGSYRVDRGGSWNDWSFCRSSYRDDFNPSYGDGNLGFRLVRRP